MHGHIRQRHSPAGGPAMVGFNTQATKMFELKYPTDYQASFFFQGKTLVQRSKSWS